MRKIKVLHVVASMGYGGVQTWLVDLVKEARDSDVQLDILCYSSEKFSLAEKAKEYGARMFVCPNHHNVWTLYRTLRDINKANGPYDAIHAHNMFQSGLVLACAKILGIPVRISQSHNATKRAKINPFRQLYNLTMTQLLPLVGTHLLAVSHEAGQRLYGKKWGQDKRHQVLYCGLDFSPFANNAQDPISVRQEFGIPATAKVIGHVGRFSFEKNHNFLVEVAAEVMKADDSVWLMLVGDGALKPDIEKKVETLGIADRTVFTGLRSDVSKLMPACFDLFIMPSHCEGLPLVLLEAFAAGKPCLISDAITKETDLIPDLVNRLPLAVGASVWQDEVSKLLAVPSKISQVEACEQVIHSLFSVKKSFEASRSLWKEELCVKHDAE